ncbi:hypothetical protein BJ878DRAFT_573522 [Calycina marina]|uniref:Uncharacterized protein n=1 Tax=Calycina marina TaxID=1763456 RepID=A0A9P8CJ02_9HELO|nr:hypothetical protein BJ878DRAFT_573522 [Calycina marina]
MQEAHYPGQSPHHHPNTRTTRFGLESTLVNRHHFDPLRSYGAQNVFSYKYDAVVSNITKTSPKIMFILDCIGSKSASLHHIAKIAARGSRAAVLLLVIATAAGDLESPM